MLLPLKVSMLASMFSKHLRLDVLRIMILSRFVLPGSLPSHNMFTDYYLQPRITVHGLPGYTGGILPPNAVDPRPPTLPLDGFECIRTLGMTSLFQNQELDSTHSM
jgi:hypothetical protein